MRWAHSSYRLLCFACLFNIAATLVLVSSGAKGSFLNILYAIFNFIILSLVGLYSFYNAYKGLATNNMSMSMKYILIQGLAIVFMVVSVSAYGANFNGLGSLRKVKQASARLKDMWVAWVIIESVLWLINLCVGIYSVYKVQQNRREGRPTAFPLTQNPGPGRALCWAHPCVGAFVYDRSYSRFPKNILKKKKRDTGFIESSACFCATPSISEGPRLCSPLLPSTTT